jgi:hypothetical protein
MIEDLSGHVDQTEGRLNKAMKKMQDFIHKSEGLSAAHLRLAHPSSC